MSTSSMSSAVEEVRVFLRGAEIKRRMVMDTAEGKNIAVFDGLPQDVHPESINASVEKGGILISADFEVDSFTEPVVSKDLKELEKRLKKVKEAIKAEKRKLDLLSSEEEFLNSNRRIGGKEGFAVSDLKEIEGYHIGRKEAISSSRAEAESKLEDLQEEKERIAAEMGAFPSGIVRYAGKISVEFFSENEGKAELVVSYYVNSAWWRPFHEIRMSDMNAPVIMNMKGSIVQNTGEDWEGVNIRLSTGNPMLGNEQPVMRPWYIDLVTPQRLAMPMPAQVARERSYADISPTVDAECEMVDEMFASKMMEPAVQVQEAHTATEFALPVKMDIPSSGKPSKVEILRHELAAEFFYYCASRLDTDAFLIAKIEGWESLNILAGETSIFQGNEYVGKTYLDPASMDDTMEISLGRDRGIIVTREKGNSMSSKGVLGKNKKALRERIVTVRNTRNKEITLKLVDQLPVSVNSAVIVEPQEISGAEHEKETGMLTWSLNIPAGGSAKKVLRYEVTYPKNGIVHLD